MPGDRADGDAIDIARFRCRNTAPRTVGATLRQASSFQGSGNRRSGHRSLPILLLGKDTLSTTRNPFHRFGKNIAKCERMGVAPRPRS